MRILLVPALAFILSGCAALAIPPALTIASYATDGASYLATDKSLTDHMLSDALGRNCAVWRILRARSICKDFTPEELIARAKARREQRHDDERGQIAQIDGPFARSGASEGLAAVPVPKKAVKPAPNAQRRAVTTVDLIAVKPSAGGPAKQPGAGLRGKPRTISGILTGTAKAKTKPNVVRLASLRRSAKSPRRVTTSTSLPTSLRRFIVFGSFRNKRAAARLARRHRILDPFVVPARVRGATYYRVVTQPEGRASIASAFRSLKRAGVKDAYAIRACRSGRVNARCLRQVPRQDRAALGSLNIPPTPEVSARPAAAGAMAGG